MNNHIIVHLHLCERTILVFFYLAHTHAHIEEEREWHNNIF